MTPKNVQNVRFVRFWGTFWAFYAIYGPLNDFWNLKNPTKTHYFEAKRLFLVEFGQYLALEIEVGGEKLRFGVVFGPKSYKISGFFPEIYVTKNPIWDFSLLLFYLIFCSISSSKYAKNRRFLAYITWILLIEQLFCFVACFLVPFCTFWLEMWGIF